MWLLGSSLGVCDCSSDARGGEGLLPRLQVDRAPSEAAWGHVVWGELSRALRATLLAEIPPGLTVPEAAGNAGCL